MIILPDRNIRKAKVLVRVPDREWRAPSQAQKKDQFGRENRTIFRVRARLNDGHTIWVGWFDDRSDFDHFLWAITSGELWRDPYIQKLPTPWWPGLDPIITYDFATVTFLTDTAVTSYSSPSDWNNSSNSIEGIGGGGSGGVSRQLARVSGGGGGEYRKIANYNIAVPGTTSVTYAIGTGGPLQTRTTNGQTAGADGVNTTWNTSSLIAVAGKAGDANSGANINGGAGGTGGTGAAGNADGGRGGNCSASSTSSGGGGAGGPNGAGNQGVDNSSNSTATNGGSGDAGSGGTAGSSAAGTGNQTAGNGGNGSSEWTSSPGGVGAGSGGGGGSAISTSGNTTTNGGSGGNYGGGGGAAQASTGTINSGAGIQGIIVVTYAPLISSLGWVPSLDMRLPRRIIVSY